MCTSTLYYNFLFQYFKKILKSNIIDICVHDTQSNTQHYFEQQNLL